MMGYSNAERSTSQNIQGQQDRPTATARFADNRISSGAQLQLQRMMNSSPQALAQCKIQESIHSSPVTQKQAIQCAEDEELLQGKFAAEPTAQLEEKPNNTGLPNQLKAGIESLSGMSMDHVKVHYNSDKPAQLNAHAYAQGSDIHVASGQEKHLPHEAWHVVQQAQGRVKPTMQMKAGVPVNDDVGLETEADAMGAKAISVGTAQMSPNSYSSHFVHSASDASVQLKKYTMTRSLPLTTKVKEKNSKDTWTKYIDALRREFPLPQDQIIPEEHKKNNEYKDGLRGGEFLIRKKALMEHVKDGANYEINSPHVAGIDMGERTRVGTAANKIKAIAGSDWIGAHLVKDSWGGMDNMMNVVAWPQAAEDEWSAKFEDPIDDAFLYQSVDSGRIDVVVHKDDEVVPASVHKSKEEVDGDLGRTSSAKEATWLSQQVETVRWKVNRAVETVPELALGESTIPSHALIGGDLTGYNYANQIANNEVAKIYIASIDALKNTKVNPAALNNAKSQELTSDKFNTERSKERKKAIIEEFKNLKPTDFEQNLEDISPQEYQ